MLATFCGYQGHLLSRRAPKAGAVDSETLMAQSLLQPLEAAEAAVNRADFLPEGTSQESILRSGETDLS